MSSSNGLQTLGMPWKGSNVRTIKQQARIAGFLYLLLALIAPIGLLYVPGKVFTPGNATATVDNIRSHELLLRVGIASELVHQIVAVFLVLALYRLFKPVSENLARQVVIFGALVSVPIMFVNVLNEIASLILASGADLLGAFTGAQLDRLAYLFYRLHSSGIKVVSVFWGIWLFPFGILVIRSGFIPKVFGVLLMIAGSAYLVSSFVAIVLPELEPQVARIALPLEVAEFPIILWLAFWGAKPTPRPSAG